MPGILFGAVIPAGVFVEVLATYAKPINENGGKVAQL